MPAIVNAKARTGKFNKNAARRVRAAGKIPAVIYGPGSEPVAVEVEPKQVEKILYSETGHNTIFSLKIDAQPEVQAMIVDWQREPINDRLIHIDMKRIAMDKVMQVSVAIRLIGVPVGVKTFGGILDQVLREVEVECLPADIPSHFDVDITNLGVHQVLRISDLPHSGSVKFLKPEDTAVAHVVSVREEAAPAEGAAAPAEPEVAKKGKQDEAKKAEKK